MMHRFFWNASEDRLRAGWRILIQVLLVAIPLGIIGASGFYTSGTMMNTKVAFTALPITLLSIFITGRYIDKRKFSDFGLFLKQKKWWADYGFGFLAGVLGASGYIFLMKLLGWAELSRGGMWRAGSGKFVAALLIALVTYAAVGVFEELMRAYQIRNITEGLAQTKLRLVGATLMGISIAGVWSIIGHVASKDPQFLVYIFITAFTYGLFFPWTKRVALAMAVHFAWDFTLSSIFSGGQELSFFVVNLNGLPDVGIHLTTIIGIVGQIFILILVSGWIRLREGEIRLHRELASPTLIARESNAD